MSGPENAADGLLASFHRTVARWAGSSDETSIRRIREATEGLGEAVRTTLAVTTTATDPSGYVRAEVAGDGRLLGLTISAYGMRDLDAPALGVACREAIRSARAQAADALKERLRGEFGAVFDRPSREDIMARLQAEIRR